MSDDQSKVAWKALEIISANATAVFFEDSSTGNVEVAFLDYECPLLLILGTDQKNERRILWHGTDQQQASSAGANLSIALGVKVENLIRDRTLQ